MAAKKANWDAWMPLFLAKLGDGATIKQAAATAAVSPGTAYYFRSRDRAFAAAWHAAQAPDAARTAIVARVAPPPRHAGWRIAFLEALAETSSVTASARRAGVPLQTVYKTRRRDPAFAAQWRAALHEGYDNLEMELLGYLRDPQPARKFDVASALRLLAAHRETVMRELSLIHI